MSFYIMLFLLSPLFISHSYLHASTPLSSRARFLIFLFIFLSLLFPRFFSLLFSLSALHSLLFSFLLSSFVIMKMKQVDLDWTFSGPWNHKEGTASYFLLGDGQWKCISKCLLLFNSDCMLSFLFFHYYSFYICLLALLIAFSFLADLPLTMKQRNKLDINGKMNKVNHV